LDARHNELQRPKDRRTTRLHRPISEPIVRSTTYAAPSAEAHRELWRCGSDAFYQRFGNPTVRAASEAVARFEGAATGLVASSGMAAITTTLLTVLRAGDHVVAQRRIFAQTAESLDHLAGGLGIDTTFVDPPNVEVIEAALQPHTRVIYVETPSNPELVIVDLASVAALARKSGALLIVDSTFASPLLQLPLDLGASLVLHSGTKYLSGHSDVLCGAVAGSKELVERVRQTQRLLGGVLDPGAAWLLLRGLKTLPLRVARQCETALAIACRLAGARGVLQVSYPWLEESPGFAVARRQMSAGGGVVSFEVEGGAEGARSFLDALERIPIATSLGGVETMVEIPADLDFDVPRDAFAVAPGLIRLSVGIEDVNDLLGDLDRGLAALRVRQGAAAQ
jgi:methionine-gamma-lyase